MTNFEIFKEKLNNAGYKLTTQRRVVFEIINSNEGKHFSPEEIYEIVKIKHPEIGLATIYRTLKLFEKIDIVYKLNFNDGCSRFELSHVEDEAHRHHHLVCQVCGKIEEVKIDLLQDLEKIIEDEYDFSIHNHTLKFYGICSDCKNRRKKCKKETTEN
ncbi:Fur family transcriptional regulator, ferric uptake regulator [Dethiosulfatibacter aminovorans DSM 17477]|uniref:Fur family transcriptional regulator, ferric uptake regulator n=1 Tax=Dethiosulfatibacter aminovorans DSM 17477 TaxID=1121476 RepID=A0A1M6D6B1_9FIRM|nr:transcriptional repressor [Dethiosulfatibacter aminovorans]SHI68785.1 Fur family transcriptional regulator, ferric uptake regulator [Dethiosulfatibacter aminovorans DSM 17477]